MNDAAPVAGMTVFYLIFGILLLIPSLFWVLFPILVYDQLKKIHKAISERKPPAPPVFDLSEIAKLRNDFRAVNFNRINCGACGVGFDYLVRLSGTPSTCPHCNAEVNLP